MRETAPLNTTLPPSRAYIEEVRSGFNVELRSEVDGRLPPANVELVYRGQIGGREMVKVFAGSS